MDNAPHQQIISPNREAVIRSNKVKKTWGLICLTAPTALLVAAIFLYAIVNFIYNGGGGTGRTLANVGLFLVGALVVISWLPGIIVGIILLATRKPVPKQ